MAQQISRQDSLKLRSLPVEIKSLSVGKYLYFRFMNLERNKADVRRIESGFESQGEFDCELVKPKWFDQRLWEQGRAFYNEYSESC